MVEEDNLYKDLGLPNQYTGLAREVLTRLDGLKRDAFADGTAAEIASTTLIDFKAQQERPPDKRRLVPKRHIPKT